ncbi:eIF3 subunit 6 N terminal domain-domain-containing protein [Naematelia encephala]|uniref:Eukaryotic translation initiation factor 3 subunit E n=1 Tax=Naematelia encephala TaxID=71784 RepID=A0A1Y2B900_9TREE|nr:eIF3 subunit 6 N terminal domain-domain-containing protein [Naematelia encephala]
MAEYDLTQQLIPHLDRQLAIPLLAHLSDIAIFPAEQLAKAQYDLVKGTNMVDYVEQLYSQLPNAEPKDFSSLREAATSKYQTLQEAAQPVMKVIEDPDAVAKLRSNVDREKNLEILRTEYNIDIDGINALYHFGQYQYSLGAYANAANFLYHFLLFSPSFDLNISAHWGKLACNILVGEWESALTEVKDLRDLIDNPHGTSMSKPLAQLQARTWLLHWSLFVFFNLGEVTGCQSLLEMFLTPAYLNTIQTSCPHLLRYLVAAAIISRRAPKPAGTRGNRDHVKDLTKIVSMEEYQYSDPVTSFLKDLFSDFDFGKAQERLSVAESVVRQDFFLSGFADEFVENARWLISEVFCRIHQRIDISELSKTLNLSNEEGEKWIVNLIRDSRMGVDAKIDLKSNMLHISRHHTTPTVTLIETTRGLAFRSQAVNYAMQSTTGERRDGGERGRGRGRPRGGRSEVEAAT